MRQLAYFTVRSNLPFNQFPNLLATVNSCGLNLGDINHTESFIDAFLTLVNEELCKKTADWFNSENEVTATLDIGTVYGISLLATLFIGNNGSVKLANITPITSKKGADVARVCYDAMKMDEKISEEAIKEKIVGLTGDGAFAKANKPFKQTIRELLGKDVPIRWDVLHLANRAHKDARGKAKYDEDKEHDNDLEEDTHEDDPDPAAATEVSRLIDFIQAHAKKYRSGIKYTDLVLSSGGNFRRPVVWSNTRMVLYEFDMLQRFLQNKVYFDHPQKWLLLAMVHCLVMFALKIILKCVQKTNISRGYIQSVIIEGNGKKAMKLASKVAVDAVNNEPLDYLLAEDIEESYCNVSLTRKGFARELHDYVEDNLDNFKITEQPRERSTRNNTEVPFTVAQGKEICDSYTDRLWRAISDRLNYADLDDLSSCAFSEAPAESVFSVYARVTEGRERLGIAKAIGLTRVAMQEPPPSTEAAAKLSADALSNYQSHLGERFCTQMWFKGKTSSTIKNLQKKQWKW